MVGIIDYGMGNLLSVLNALESVGAEAKVCDNPGDVAGFERVVLPGVGAFHDCIDNLRNKGFIDPLNAFALRAHKPVLGICLGMQAMARKSFEGGEYDGLGWFDADVVRIEPGDKSLRVPQIGWNNISYRESPLLSGLPREPDFYFVHSFHMKCNDGADVIATCGNAVSITYDGKQWV